MKSVLNSNPPRQPGSAPCSSSPPPVSHTVSSSRLTTKPISCDSTGVAFSPSQCAWTTPKYAPSIFDNEDDDQNDENDIAVTVTVKSVSSASSSCSSSVCSTASDFHAAMSIRGRAKRQSSGSLPPSSPPSTTTGLCRPTTPTSPVQIPKRSYHDTTHHVKKEAQHRRRYPKGVQSPDAISPSVAALLAVTDIRRPRRRPRDEKLLVAEEIVPTSTQVSEKEFSLSISRSPMDVLLASPEDLMDDEYSATESTIGSMLARTTSADSVPSLEGESFVTDFGSSIDTPRSHDDAVRRRLSPMRKSLEPVHALHDDVAEGHPLATDILGIEKLQFSAAEQASDDSTSSALLQPFKPLRSAFKSNLTASLRALRSAAKSFSNINFPSIPPDDFLTRSILTIDPHVPYMDERRPPVTEEMPSAELRRYLNPTSTLIDSQPKSSPVTFSASIQMQTYKVQRSRSSPPTSRSPHVTAGTSPSASSGSQQTARLSQAAGAAPSMRQREMRENPDFIRIAVMEMAMRRRGKLDNQKPGRARWALPPRRPSTKPYEIGSSGVPTRWIPVTHS